VQALQDNDTVINILLTQLSLERKFSKVAGIERERERRPARWQWAVFVPCLTLSREWKGLAG